MVFRKSPTGPRTVAHWQVMMVGTTTQRPLGITHRKMRFCRVLVAGWRGWKWGQVIAPLPV